MQGAEKRTSPQLPESYLFRTLLRLREAELNLDRSFHGEDAVGSQLSHNLTQSTLARGRKLVGHRLVPHAVHRHIGLAGIKSGHLVGYRNHLNAIKEPLGCIVALKMGNRTVDILMARAIS